MKGLIRTIGFFAFMAIISLSSCKNGGDNAGIDDQGKVRGASGKDGGIILSIADADMIQVDERPQYNTAEWLFRVDKPGRYDVWLSSLTLDTTQLLFAENVVITAGETRLAKKPIGDEIVTDDKSVSAPWYRADSHMGSVFFSKAGEYPVQVISDRVERRATDLSTISKEERTLINSVILKPKVN